MRRRGGRTSESFAAAVLAVVVVVGFVVAVGVYSAGLFPGRVAPKADFGTVQSGTASADESSVVVRFPHESGEAVDASRLAVRVDGTPATEIPAITVSIPEGTVTSGEVVTVEQRSAEALTGGETVTLVYESGGETAVLARHEVQGTGS